MTETVGEEGYNPNVEEWVSNASYIRKRAGFQFFVDPGFKFTPKTKYDGYYRRHDELKQVTFILTQISMEDLIFVPGKGPSEVYANFQILQDKAERRFIYEKRTVVFSFFNEGELLTNLEWLPIDHVLANHLPAKKFMATVFDVLFFV